MKRILSILLVLSLIRILVGKELGNVGNHILIHYEVTCGKLIVCITS